MATVKCPSCGARVEWRTDSPYRPFCSERCKLIDLGAWASDRYAIGTTSSIAEGEAPADGAPARDQ